MHQKIVVLGVHILNSSDRYGMWDPADCLKRDPPPKAEYKEYVLTKITSFLAATSSSRSDGVTKSIRSFVRLCVVILYILKHSKHMFQGSFKGVLRKFQGCFKEVSRVFQGSFKKVARVFQRSFKSVSRKF